LHFIPQPVWAAAFGLAQTSCVAGLAVSSFRLFNRLGYASRPVFRGLTQERSVFMPIYEYFCKNCEKEFELLIRGTQKPVCPYCGGKKLDRQMSAPASPTHANGCPIERGSSDAASYCAHGGCCGGHCPH